MKRQNPFKMSALNSLQVHQVHIKDEKQLLNTFKGGNDLRNQLNNLNNTKNNNTLRNTSGYKGTIKNLNNNNNNSINNHNNTLNKSKNLNLTHQLIKPQHQTLYDQIAALDTFKAPVTRQKTKNLIQSITLRRRQQHIQSYSQFKQDLDDYKQNLLSIYQTVFTDCTQVLHIKYTQLEEYYNSQKDQYLLNREKQIIQEFQQEYNNFINSTNEKIKLTYEELERVKKGRGTVVDETCERLRQELIQIAFVLENEAREIQQKEKDNILILEQQFYDKYFKFTQQQQQKLKEKQVQLHQKMEQVCKKWKQLKQNFQFQKFQNTLTLQQYNNPLQLQAIYKNILKLQISNHQQKKSSFISLIHNQHVDSLRKANLDKWYQIIKSINQQFDKQFDLFVSQLVQQNKKSKSKHHQLLQKFTSRLIYIENHTQSQINQLIQTKYKVLMQKNITFSQQLMKNVTNYVEKNDQKQNLLYQNIYKFITLIAVKNDDFVKEFLSFSQKYEIEKAKILDDDEELVEKLQNQLENCKKQLKEALHHIKLQEIQKKCFEKIDQIQQAYRKTHQKNKQLVSQRPAQLTQFMLNFEAKMAQIFQLYQQSKRNQLITKNKQAAEKQAMRRIQQQDKKKAEQQAKQLQQLLAKGGKAPPPPKPKDPKKVAAELQERKKVILAQIGEKKIQQLKMSSGNVWLVYKSLQQICRQFYKAPQQQSSPKQGQPQAPTQSTKQLLLQSDQLPPPILSIIGTPITSNQSLLSILSTSKQLLFLRDNIFKNVDSKKQRILSQSFQNNQQLIDQSLTVLDDRLKKHYSLKGELQAEIFVKRSGEITNHKKRYEKYARSVRQKMDNQTERFNFLLEKSLELIKKHNSDQKATRQKLPTAKNLSQLQGLLSKARENHHAFTSQIKQILSQLHRLSGSQIESLLKRNQDFIKQSKPLSSGGQYSEEQISWYTQMMQQINQQITTQKQKRQQKNKQIQTSTEKIKKDLLDKFEKEYNMLIEQLSAKDGTGKKYGKPKRIAQEKIRLQMNKCEKAQININQQIQELIKLYEKQRSNSFISKNNQKPSTIEWRHKLMTLSTCISQYCKHIQALKPQLKIKPMPRVNYDQTLPDFSLPNLTQQDKTFLQQQLSHLGPLSQQKQQKTFMKYIIDIQKIISDQARTIYTGDKAKYLTGNDKLPDFLRKYIGNMKKSAEDFRQSSVRELRDSCMRLGDLCEKFSEMFFKSIENYYQQVEQNNFNQLNKEFNEFYQKNQHERKQNLRCLRPNLSNPKCQQQLTQLNKKQLQRQSIFIEQIKKYKQKFTTYHFQKGTQFINLLINNYQFLLTYCDSLYLYEDFIKVIGDDEDQKAKLNIKKLMIMKQKGVNIDSSSERNLKKKWDGVDFTIINFDDKKYVYKKPQVQDTNAKDPKKAAKKQAKKPAGKAQQAPVTTQSQTTSRVIQTFKTWRQKSVFQYRQQCLNNFKLIYQQILDKMNQKFNRCVKENQMFNNKWVNIAKELVLK